jgi:hypothetical protein
MQQSSNTCDERSGPPVFSVAKDRRFFRWAVWRSESELSSPRAGRRITHEEEVLRTKTPAACGRTASRDAAVTAALAVAPDATPVEGGYALGIGRMVTTRREVVRLARLVARHVEGDRELLETFLAVSRYPGAFDPSFRAVVSVAREDFTWIRHGLRRASEERALVVPRYGANGVAIPIECVFGFALRLLCGHPLESEATACGGAFEDEAVRALEQAGMNVGKEA